MLRFFFSNEDSFLFGVINLYKIYFIGRYSIEYWNNINDKAKFFMWKK